jgi:hypothetical protein
VAYYAYRLRTSGNEELWVEVAGYYRGAEAGGTGHAVSNGGGDVQSIRGTSS